MSDCNCLSLIQHLVLPLFFLFFYKKSLISNNVTSQELSHMFELSTFVINKVISLVITSLAWFIVTYIDNI